MSFLVVRKDPFLGYALVAFRSGVAKDPFVGYALVVFPSGIVLDEKIERNRS